MLGNQRAHTTGIFNLSNYAPRYLTADMDLWGIVTQIVFALHKAPTPYRFTLFACFLFFAPGTPDCKHVEDLATLRNGAIPSLHRGLASARGR